MTPEVQILSGIGIGLLILTAFLGNAMTVAAYIMDKKLHNVYNFYIFNLAVTDILIACVSMPFYGVYTLMDFTWPFGYVFCKVWSVVDYTLCLETILLMLLLSVDRLLLITSGPFYSIKITIKTAAVIVSASWAISFLVYGPAIIGWNHWVGYSTVEYMDCDVEFAYSFAFTTSTAIAEFILPCVVLTSLNTVIYWKIMKRKRIGPRQPRGAEPHLHNRSSETANPLFAITMADSLNSKTKITDTNVPSCSATNQAKATKTLGFNSGCTEKYKASQDSKAAKFLSILVGTFLVLWAPYSITTVIKSFCETYVNFTLYEFFVWILWVKCAVNPFLYAFNSVQYRSNFRKFLICFVRKPQVVSPFNNTNL